MPKGGKGGGGSGAIRGNKRDNVLDGTGGDDLIEGLAGNDILSGFAGNDTLDGGEGHDTLLGGDGDDSLLGGLGDDLLDAGAGTNTADGGAGSDTIVFAGNRDDYVVTQIDADTVEISGPEGTTLVTAVESFAFADMTQSFAEVVVPRLANLTADGAAVSDAALVAGDVFEATWDIGSNGVIGAPSSTTTLVIASAPDLGAAVQTHSLTAAGGATGTSESFSAFVDTAGLAPGTYYVAAVADDGDAISESDEGDNVTQWIEISIAAPVYNLSLGEVSLPAGADLDLNGGATLPLTATVSNTGNSGDGAFEVVTVLSASGDINSGDMMEILRMPGTLAPGETVTLSGTAMITDGLPAGTYHVITYVDWGANAEADFDDNIVVSADTVTFIGGTTYGTDGADTFFGTYTDEAFQGFGGDDLVIGSAGSDGLFGGDGMDTVDYSGLAHAVQMFNDYGNANMIVEGYDDPYGPAAWIDYLDSIETVLGTEYDDAVFIENGSVRHVATFGGNDAVLGSVGDDTIESGAGDDIVAGWFGDDMIFTGDGFDLIAVGRDTSAGPAVGHGHDVVMDFDVMADILLVEYTYGDPYDPFADLAQTADGALLSYADGSSVLLWGVDVGDLHAGNLVADVEDTMIYY